MSGPVGATRRTTAERVESTVELCRSDKSTCHYDSKTRESVRVASRLDAPGTGSSLVLESCVHSAVWRGERGRRARGAGLPAPAPRLPSPPPPGTGATYNYISLAKVSFLLYVIE